MKGQKRCLAKSMCDGSTLREAISSEQGLRRESHEQKDKGVNS